MTSVYVNGPALWPRPSARQTQTVVQTVTHVHAVLGTIKKM